MKTVKNESCDFLTFWPSVAGECGFTTVCPLCGITGLAGDVFDRNMENPARFPLHRFPQNTKAEETGCFLL